MEQHSFGYWLRLKRKALDLTREELAERAGYSAATIRKIEDEERRPSGQIVERLADIFKIPQNEREAFLQFARGGSKFSPAQIVENLPWRASGTSPRSNIPAITTSLIAREKEIALVREYLTKDDIRLVTLMGPPGIGKTRLSIEAAREVLPDFSDGVFFATLALLDDPHSIASAIIQALGYMESGESAPEDQLIESIGQKKMLIVLDNCEHLIEEIASIASSLLSACPGLKILATSRESLRIPGEWLYPVPAFDIPNESGSIDLDNASDFPALMLFVERARAVQPDFKLTAENIRTIAAICARLDGLPLVIELIAARVRLMSPESLLERMSIQFVLTADGMRAPSERQKTLKNAIGWSYDLLSPEEQKLFIYLSVFSGNFTFADVDQIFAHTLTKKSIPELLTLLLDKSLIRRVTSASTDDAYAMLVTIREYAHEHLQNTSEETEVRNWHLAYFLDLAEQADKEIHGPDQIEWMDWLETEHDNLRAALDWSVASQQTDLSLRLFVALGWPWLARTHYSEIQNGFEKIRALSKIDSYPALYARALNFMGRLNWLLGNYQEAQAFLEESQAIWLKLGIEGERGLAEALGFLGLVAYSKKIELKTAQSLFERSLELYQKHKDEWGTAFILFQLGMLALTRKDNSSALSLLDQSMELFNRLGDIWGKGRVSHLLGELVLRQGDHEKARFFFEQNLRFDEELKFKPGMVVALSNLGDLHRYQSHYDQARQYFEKSLEVSRTYGINETWGLGLYSLGLVALHQNKYSVAKQYFADHFKTYRGSFDQVRLGTLFLSQAAISAGTNQLEREARLSGAAQAIFETLDYRISSFDQAEFDRHIQVAREQLGTDKFKNLANEGRALTMEEAIAYALEDDL